MAYRECFQGTKIRTTNEISPAGSRRKYRLKIERPGATECTADMRRNGDPVSWLRTGGLFRCKDVFPFSLFVALGLLRNSRFSNGFIKNLFCDIRFLLWDRILGNWFLSKDLGRCSGNRRRLSDNRRGRGSRRPDRRIRRLDLGHGDRRIRFDPLDGSKGLLQRRFLSRPGNEQHGGDGRSRQGGDHPGQDARPFGGQHGSLERFPVARGKGSFRFLQPLSDDVNPIFYLAFPCIRESCGRGISSPWPTGRRRSFPQSQVSPQSPGARTHRHRTY